eukprot:scaffold115163_cov74-Phaeocystis_antarctica.AAC.1
MFRAFISLPKARPLALVRSWTRPLRAPMPRTRLAALASGLAKRLASCFASAKRRWHALMVRLGTRSRQPARTTAPAESVDRVAQLSEPLLVAAAEEPLVSDTAGGRCWWTRKQRKAAQKLRVQRSVMLRVFSRTDLEAFEEELLSSVLVPLVLAPLQPEDGVAATAAEKPPGRKTRKQRKAAQKLLVQRSVEKESVDRLAQFKLVCEQPARVDRRNERHGPPGRKTRKQRVAAHTQPVQRSVVEEVLLSSDLLPLVLAPLQLGDDGAVAVVCSQWNDSWEEKLGAKLPLTLKFWSLFYDCDVMDSDAEEEVKIASSRFGITTHLTVGHSEGERIKQVRSLAQAVQVQEEAAATGTYLFMKHQHDRMSKQDWKEWAADSEAYNVEYHHHVPCPFRAR